MIVRPRPKALHANNTAGPPAAARARPKASSASAFVVELQARAQPVAYVAEAEDEEDDCVVLVDPMKTEFFDTVGKVRALAVRPERSPCNLGRTLAEARGYADEDLMAVAEIAYHYLMSGGTRLAEALFEGLAAVAPGEAYFAMGLGLARDRLGDKGSAEACYRRASDLDPGDGRPDINRGELLLEDGDHRAARPLLAAGAKKARVRGQIELAEKATAILAHLEASRPVHRSVR